MIYRIRKTKSGYSFGRTKGHNFLKLELGKRVWYFEMPWAYRVVNLVTEGRRTYRNFSVEQGEIKVTENFYNTRVFHNLFSLRDKLNNVTVNHKVNRNRVTVYR